MSCPVCNAETKVTAYECEVAPYQGKVLNGHLCTGCGFVQFPDNLGGFSKVVTKATLEGSLRSLRNANDERPGREFYMAEMGMEIQGSANPSVTFFGSGLNTDHRWMVEKHPNARAKLVDLENMQGLDIFEPIGEATPSDVIVASEVIEHFEEPLEHFKTLIRLIKDDGILICSSNIYDGTDIRRHQYPFVPGHVAYWSPLALIKVAAELGCFVDFRTPEVGMHRGGPRKKYIVFYKNIEMLFRISLYFGTHRLAPSEKD